MLSVIHALWICAASTMVGLAGVLIYRSTVSMKEDDQLFLDPAEWQLEREQEAIVNRLNRLAPVVWGLAIASITLLALIAAIWIYENMRVVATPFLRFL